MQCLGSQTPARELRALQHARGSGCGDNSMFDVLADLIQQEERNSAKIIGAQERNLNCGFLQEVIGRPSRRADQGNLNGGFWARRNFLACASPLRGLAPSPFGGD
jgi:hypothetical protein